MKNAMPICGCESSFFSFSITRLACVRYKLFNPLALERALAVSLEHHYRRRSKKRAQVASHVVLRHAENTIVFFCICVSFPHLSRGFEYYFLFRKISAMFAPWEAVYAAHQTQWRLLLHQMGGIFLRVCPMESFSTCGASGMLCTTKYTPGM